MNNKERYDKAKRLDELTGSGKGYIRGSGIDVPADSPRAKHEAMVKEFHIEARAKYMTSDQLDALLNFYSSDMGKSILEAQEQIKKEMSRTLAALIDSSPNKALRVPRPQENHGDDT